MIKNYIDWLNESWYPTFKAQGECINVKDHVTLAELEQIGEYFRTIYKMKNVQVGEIEMTPTTSSYTSGDKQKAYGVVGTRRDHFLYHEEFSYYWKDGEEDYERGWVGRLDMKGRSPRQFMSPFEFLECVEMHYAYSHEWVEQVSKEHLSTMRSQMEKLGMKSPRKGRIAGRKYGLSESMSFVENSQSIPQFRSYDVKWKGKKIGNLDLSFLSKDLKRDEIEIAGLILHPEAQGQNYGRKAVETIWEEFPHVNKVFLQSIKDAEPFWRKVGAVESRERPGYWVIRK